MLCYFRESFLGHVFGKYLVFYNYFFYYTLLCRTVCKYLIFCGVRVYFVKIKRRKIYSLKNIVCHYFYMEYDNIPSYLYLYCLIRIYTLKKHIYTFRIIICK